MSENNSVWEKMVNGEIYDALDSHLLDMLCKTRARLWEYNNLHPDKTDEAKDMLRAILGSVGKDFHFNQPFRCDYGCNIHIGERFFANFNFTVLDEAPVTIGDNAFIGPDVSIFTACHPLDPIGRNTRQEWAEPVTIGNNVWIGGGAIILPGVTIGNTVVVGAGSVVTKDVPSDVVVAGNPAKIIKTLKS